MSRSELAEIRRKFIEARRVALLKKVSAVELKLYNSIFDKILSELDKSGGKILSNNKNIELSTALNKIFKDINKSEYFEVIKSFGADLGGVLALNKSYFEIVAEDKKKIEKISKDVNGIMRKKLGLDVDGEIIKKGYLGRLIKDDSFQKKVKQVTLKAVTSGKSFKDFNTEIKKLIVGSDKVDGGLAKYLNTFAYDTYEQVNRGTSKLYAIKLDLKAFIYAGSTIDSSRCFCEKNNGKVFTINEAEKWKNILNSDCGPIWNEKTDGAYDPITMLGGYQCRHVPDFISDTTAKKLRPDIMI